MLNIKNLFNESYYLGQNPDLVKAISSGIIQSGLDHFQKFGQFEGRNPSASFDTNYYLQQNQDVAAVVKSGQISAVGHFLQFGQFEGRNPNIFFDTSYYLQQNQDIAAVVQSGQITAVEHFLQFGQIEKRNPGKFFDTSYYLQQNPDIEAAVKSGQVTAFDHFLQFGEKEGRNAIASYDNNQYLKRYSDVADAVGKGQLFSAYRHFVVYGESLEKRFGVNTAPMAMDDTNSTIEGTAIKISVLANDTDLNKDTLSITSFTQAAKGQVVDNKDGTFTYTPNSAFTGNDFFNYSITDSYDGIGTGKVNLNVVQKPSVTLALASNSVLENGNTGLAYTFTRTNVIDNALTVNFNVTGDAVFGGTGADYTQLGAATFESGIGTVMFKPGEATATVTLNPIGDTLVESDETVGLTLATGTNYTVGTTAAVNGTIANDDTSVMLALASNSVLENSGTGLAYTFTRTGVTNNALTVNFKVGGDALFGDVIGADYTQLGAASFASGIGTVTFGANDTTKTVTLTPVADNIVEANETVALTLADGTGYTAGTTTAVTGTIRNDDTSVMLSIAPDGVKEDSGSGLVYTFTRTGVTDNALTVNFGVEGTATFGTTDTDYSQSDPASFNATSGTVTFAANQTTKTVTLTPKVDNVVELDEAIALILRTGTGYTLGTTTPVIGTIKNDDTSVTVAVAPTDGVLEDSGTDLVYTFTRDGAIDNDLSVNFNVGGNAVFETDYDLSGADNFGVTNGTVMFNAGESTATVTVTAIADTDVETNEAVTLSLGTGAGYTLGTTTTAIGTIKNDDTLVSLAVTPNGVDENSGTGLVYTFTRTGVTDNELTVNFNVGGDAVFGVTGADYTQSNAASFGSGVGTVTFAAGQDTKTVRLTPVADNVVELDKTIALTLATGTGYNVGTTTAVTSTIKNDDTLVTLAVSPDNVLEDSPTDLVYTFTRTVASDRPLTVNFNVSADADLGTDYTQSGAASFASGISTVTFAANELTKTVRLTPVADNVVELDKAIALTLTDGTNYTIGTTTTAIGIIKNDDTLVTLAVTPNNVDENSGTPLVYTFKRDGVTDNELTVNFGIIGNADLGGDYTQSGATFGSGTGTVKFGVNETTKTVTLTPKADNVVELDETVALTLTNSTGTGYTIGAANAVTGTIKNDDTSVTLAVAPNSVTEDGNNTPLVYTFTRDGVTDNELTVNFNVGGDAVVGTDYNLSVAGSGSINSTAVTFNAGEKTATVTVTPKADNVVEADEAVALSLTDGTGYTLGTTTAVTSTIKNDDTLVTLAVAPDNVLEDSNAGLVYTFTRTGVTDNALTVNFNVSADADLGGDYTQSGAASFASGIGTVTFAANELTKTVTLTPNADNVVEADEAVTLSLGTGAGYTLGTTTAVTGTIKNDDQPPTVSISALNATATELGTNGIYRISRGTNTTGNLVVNLAIDNTGTNNLIKTNDYTLSVGDSSLTGSNLTVTIADGQSFVDVNLAAVDDVQAEADETLKLNLAAGSAYTIDSVNNNATVTIAANDTVVTNYNDSVNDYTLGEGSLRQALLNAIAFEGANTISFQSSTTPQIITLAAPLPTIKGANADYTKINGGNAANLTISGNNLYRVFNVDGVSANFKNLTIANGKAEYGAGIYNVKGTVNVISSTLSNNSTIYDGSAINSDNGTVTVTNSTFNNNNSIFSSSDGAIFNNNGTLSIAGSTFTNNSPANVSGSYTDGGGNTFNPQVS